jgi:hypothetical protein
MMNVLVGNDGRRYIFDLRRLLVQDVNFVDRRCGEPDAPSSEHDHGLTVLRPEVLFVINEAESKHAWQSVPHTWSPPAKAGGSSGSGAVSPLEPTMANPDVFRRNVRLAGSKETIESHKQTVSHMAKLLIEVAIPSMVGRMRVCMVSI